MHRPTASTLCCRTARRIIPKPALPLRVRCNSAIFCLACTFTADAKKKLNMTSNRKYVLTLVVFSSDFLLVVPKCVCFVFPSAKLQSEKFRNTVDVIREAGRWGGGVKWSMSVSEWAEQMPLLFWSLKTHWEQSTLYLQSPLQSQHGEAWHKGQQSCDRPGSVQGQGGGERTHPDYLNVTPSLPYFLLPHWWLTLECCQYKEMLSIIALTISPWPDVCLRCN